MRRLTLDRFLSDDELDRFLTAVRMRRHQHQPRDAAMFTLLATTGLRPTEALALTVDDLHPATHRTGDWITVRRLKKKRPTRDELVLPAAVGGMLREYIAGAGLGSGDRLFKLHRRQVQRLFRYYARLAGLSPRFYCYCLRHTAATRIYRATRDIAVVQSVLGHDSPDTSCIYAHVSRHLLREHADAFPAAL